MNASKDNLELVVRNFQFLTVVLQNRDSNSDSSCLAIVSKLESKALPGSGWENPRLFHSVGTLALFGRELRKNS